MKKHHWHAFWHEKLFKKHPQPHYQTRSKPCLSEGGEDPLGVELLPAGGKHLPREI
jgi:hypothetical protein